MNTVATWNDLDLLPHHAKVLDERGITPSVARAHGYRSSRGERDLRALGYKGAVAQVSGALVIPLHDADGDVCGYQIRPDDEIAGDRDGSVLRYLTPPGQANVVDIPVWMGARGTNLVVDPETPIVVTEGPLKAASAASRSIPCVSIQGVSSYVGKSSSGGRGVYLPDWRQFASNRQWIIGYDSDAMSKPEVLREARRLGAYLARKPGASVTYLVLPGGADKVGLDDWLCANPDAGASSLFELVSDELPDPEAIEVDLSSGVDLVPATDLDVADAYVERYGDEVRYLTDLGRWVGYAGGRWDLSGGDSVARSLAQKLFRSIRAYRLVSDGNGGTRRIDSTDWLYASTRLDACLMQVRSNPRCQSRADDLNQSPMLLNVRNGTVDLVTGMLHPHDPRDLLTQMTEVDYEPDARAPEFERFIREVLPDGDVRGFVQRLFGMSLLGEVRDHVFTVFTGTGRNGKGVLLRIAQAVFGDYAAGIHKDLLIKTNFEGHPTHLASLYGRRLAVAQELERGAKWDVARVKELTGGDSITARWMRGNEFTFTPSHTIIMSSNHRPSVGEGERAFWTRYREVPFTVSFEGREDVTLADRIIRDELPGVLQWMIRGLLDYTTNGLGSPDAVTRATREAQEESDPLLRFLHERIEITPHTDDKIPTKDVFDAWQRWATTDGNDFRVGSYLHFGRALKGVTSSIDVGKTSSGALKGVSMVSCVRWKSPDQVNDELMEEVETPRGGSTVEVANDQDDTVYAGQSVTEVVEAVEEVVPENNLFGKYITETTEEILAPTRYIEVTSPTSSTATEAGSDESAGSTDATQNVTLSEVPPKLSELTKLTQIEWGTPVPRSEVLHVEGYRSTSRVSTGLTSTGEVSPTYKIVQGKEEGTEVVEYPEYVRRMKLAGKWVEPAPGWISDSDAA